MCPKPRFAPVLDMRQGSHCSDLRASLFDDVTVKLMLFRVCVCVYILIVLLHCGASISWRSSVISDRLNIALCNVPSWPSSLASAHPPSTRLIDRTKEGITLYTAQCSLSLLDGGKQETRLGGQYRRTETRSMYTDKVGNINDSEGHNHYSLSLSLCNAVSSCHVPIYQ